MPSLPIANMIPLENSCDKPKLRTEDAENLSIIVADIGEEWSGKNIGDSEYVEIGGERFEIIDDTYKDGAMTAPIYGFL